MYLRLTGPELLLTLAWLISDAAASISRALLLLLFSEEIEEHQGNFILF